jgi:uncharacterized repeat protein (TIGR03803 family)
MERFMARHLAAAPTMARDVYRQTVAGPSSRSLPAERLEYCTLFLEPTEAIPTSLAYNFCAKANCADGSEPFGGLIQASDGNFYGTTFNGGAYNFGTIFRMTPQGKVTTIYNFCAQSGCPDGEYPYDGVFQATDGRIYGTTYQGGSGGDGTVFRMNLGLPGFVSALPAFGKVGESIGILGYGLEKASSVTFGGISAQFTVESSTYLTAVVPTGAKSGSIAVLTPAGTLKSKSFAVLP